jgi:hypothetical protein
MEINILSGTISILNQGSSIQITILFPAALCANGLPLLIVKEPGKAKYIHDGKMHGNGDRRQLAYDLYLGRQHTIVQVDFGVHQGAYMLLGEELAVIEESGVHLVYEEGEYKHESLTSVIEVLNSM